jgi:ribosomal protein S8E
MPSRSPPSSKRGRREDDDDESRYRKKLEKGKEPTAKNVDEEPLFNDTQFVVELLKSGFRKLEGVGEAFDIKAHHDVYKDASMKGLAFRIHGLAEKLENLPVVKRATRHHFFFDDDGSDGDDGGDDGDDSSHGGDDGGTVVWTSLGPLPRWVPGLTTRWAPGTT